MTTPTPAQADEKALERAVDAFLACRPEPRVAGCDFGEEQRDILRQQLTAAIASIRPEGETVAWPKEPETGLNDASLPTLLKMTRADATPPAPAGVRVRALEWHTVRSFGGDKLRAKSIAGEWWIEQANGAADCERVERQKRACDAENEARIRSALLPPDPEAPGHTDLMVSPESIDAFLEANPLPPDPEAQAATPAEALPDGVDAVREVQVRAALAPWWKQVCKFTKMPGIPASVAGDELVTIVLALSSAPAQAAPAQAREER